MFKIFPYAFYSWNVKELASLPSKLICKKITCLCPIFYMEIYDLYVSQSHLSQFTTLQSHLAACFSFCFAKLPIRKKAL